MTSKLLPTYILDAQWDRASSRTAPCAVCRRDGHPAKERNFAWACPLMVNQSISESGGLDAIEIKELVVKNIKDRNRGKDGEDLLTDEEVIELLKKHETWGFVKPDAIVASTDLTYKLPDRIDGLIESYGSRLPSAMRAPKPGDQRKQDRQMLGRVEGRDGDRSNDYHGEGDHPIV